MITKSNTIAVVVWYHPTDEQKQLVSLYEPYVRKVIVVDNSTDNKGIAWALNRGCEQAVQQGAEWVLTMDQDSRWDQQSVDAYMAKANQYADQDNVAIFSPYHDCGGRIRTTQDYELMHSFMCSGNLLRLSAWQQTGGFKEDFFIDLVDDEINCHVRQLGWQLVRINSIHLTHNLGEGQHFTRLFHHSYTPHPVWRYFYIGRNMQRMLQLYPQERRYYHHQRRKILKRLCLYDSVEKMAKLRAFVRGWRTAIKEGTNKQP